MSGLDMPAAEHWPGEIAYCFLSLNLPSEAGKFKVLMKQFVSCFMVVLRSVLQSRWLSGFVYVSTLHIQLELLACT